MRAEEGKSSSNPMFALSYRHGLLDCQPLVGELRLLAKAQVATLFMSGLAIARLLLIDLNLFTRRF
jgi:hypothetical protein